jgi:hypothetical protein
MTKYEALKMALEALEYHTAQTRPIHQTSEAITAIKEALAHPEQDSTYTYASNLAKTIWQIHYMKDSPEWKPLDTTEGVLTQIDNMTCGLVREKPPQPKEPEQEPVAWVYPEGLEALKAGKPWTAYGTLQEPNNTALYLSPQPDIPPYAWVTFTPYGEEDDVWYENPEGQLLEGWTYKPLYDTTPPQRTWVELTDEERQEIALEVPIDAVFITEAKLKDKNR